MRHPSVRRRPNVCRCRVHCFRGRGTFKKPRGAVSRPSVGRTTTAEQRQWGPLSGYCFFFVIISYTLLFFILIRFFLFFLIDKAGWCKCDDLPNTHIHTHVYIIISYGRTPHTLQYDIILLFTVLYAARRSMIIIIRLSAPLLLGRRR